MGEYWMTPLRVLFAQKSKYKHHFICYRCHNYYVSHSSETYHIEPAHHHPTAVKASRTHNRLIYRSSDVEYAKVFGQCKAGNLTRLRDVQVRLKLEVLVVCLIDYFYCRIRQEYMNVSMHPSPAISGKRGSQVVNSVSRWDMGTLSKRLCE
jgi:hypothetical protein